MLTRVSISIARFGNQSTSFCRVYQRLVGKTASKGRNTEAQKQKNPPSEEDGLGDQTDAAATGSLQAGVERRGREA
ncbi:hypothetical protein E2553_11785 [Paraburkholderia dipogonis]|uniref:Uncharacterized protein n=1 Tax=Paraburkholderia dipogonis TaxID=1211383 RepID=A0A4Y8N796_9BURK|nr:hypothetical protein [Paraburkholderia dipogonis]TFE45640.1 hypothetical protein E2553_11785 [Paraburkholderia dipogonis]